MEKIKQALERAEQERDRLVGVANAVGSETAGETAEQSIGAHSSARSVDVDAASDAARIKYRCTKVVEVPADVLERNRLVAAMPEHKYTDVYRLLRTRVLQTMNGNRWNALAITSPATGSGKTMTAINLAVSLAREVNRTVMLADFDLRHPSIHRYFDCRPELGLSDYLFHDTPLQDILFSPSIERLVILPGRESIHNSSEMLRSPKAVSLVEELKARYPDRLVIFDLPPILAVDDALAFAPYADAMLMIAENGATQRKDLEKALTMLGDTPIIGTVLNKSESPVGGYY